MDEIDFTDIKTVNGNDEDLGRFNEGYVESPSDKEDEERGATKPSGEISQEPPKEFPKEDPKERRWRLLKQGSKMFLASLGMWSMGSMLTFPSVLANDLTDHNSTIYGTPISFTDSELDMMGSLLPLVSLPGAWLMAPLMILLGRRPSMVISGILLAISWGGVILFPEDIGLLVARGLSGFAIGCTSVAINTYAIEVPDPDVRGVMFIIINNGILAGQVVTMALGTFARYYTVAMINTMLPIAFVASLFWLPESPSFLVVKGRTEEARKTLLQLRGPNADIDAEIKSYEKLNVSSESGKGVQWRQFLERDVLKSMFVVCGLFVIMHFTGYLVVSANASRMFREAGSSLDDGIAALLVTVIQLFGGIVASFLIDRLGRRKSLFLSYSLMCIPLALMAVYVGLVGDSDTDDNGSQPYGWVPVVCLMVSQSAVVIGANPIPFIVSNEYFPTSIRSQASSICYTVGTIAGFLVLQLYSPMSDGLTLTGLFAFYASVSAIGVPFSYFFVKETMGEHVG